MNYSDKYSNTNPKWNDLLQRYESTRYGNKNYYLDTKDFEDIVAYYMFNRNLPKALDATDTALQMHPASAEILMMRAYILSVLERGSEALQTVKRLEQLMPSDDANVCYIKALALIAQGNIKDGVAFIEKALHNNEDIEDQAQSLLIIIDSLNKARAYDAALKYAEMVIGIASHNVDAMLVLARCYQKNGNIKKSIAAYNEALEMSSNSEQICMELGELYENNAQSNNALKIYNRLIAINPNNIDAYRKKAALYINLNMFKKADAVYDAVLKRFPTLVPVWHAKGQCYLNMRQSADAIEYFYKGITIDPYFADNYYGIALAMMCEKQTKRQINFIQYAIALNPYNQIYHYFLAQSYVQQRKWQMAKQVIEYCITINTDCTMAWLLLSEIQMKRSYAAAIAVLRRALKCQPHNLRIISQLAVMCYKNNDFAECWKQLENMWKDNPSSTIWFFRECPDAVENPLFLKHNFKE